MLLPITRIEVGVRNRVATVQHHGIAHIDADMGNAGGVVGADKKHKVAGLNLLRGNRGTDIAKALCAQPSHVPSAVIDYPAHKAAAIKAGAGRDVYKRQ